MQPIARGTRGEPRSVVPLMFVDIDDNGSVVRTLLRCESIRIGFQSPIATRAGLDFEFVERAFIEAGDEKFPDSRLAAQAHRVHAAVPEIEISDDTDAQRIR